MDYGYVPGQPRFFALFSSQFLHADWFHLAGNMFFLFVFGDNVEEKKGRYSFLISYLLLGAAANLAFASFHNDFQGPVIGASGAISGVMGIYAVFFPRARLWVLWSWRFLFPARAALAIGIYSGMQFVGVALRRPGAGVAYEAHIGGLAAGALLALGLRLFDLVHLEGDEGVPKGKRRLRLFFSKPEKS